MAGQVTRTFGKVPLSDSAPNFCPCAFFFYFSLHGEERKKLFADFILGTPAEQKEQEKTAIKPRNLSRKATKVQKAQSKKIAGGLKYNFAAS